MHQSILKRCFIGLRQWNSILSIDRLKNWIWMKVNQKSLSSECLSVFLFKNVIYSVFLFCALVIFVLIFKRQNHYHLYYLISLLCFLPQLYLNLNFLFGFIVILYQVSLLLKYLLSFILISDLFLLRIKISQFKCLSKVFVEV